ncbi:HD domain-containing protein [Desulfatitalea tepidiphila]|uniref:HD domain-containing protein n=1 Tax=Desulfatitalea tepidiphila TaxID=1185843 RepID=UPI0006B5A7E1|nr:HD domain-containing protein [Desulfatitalea tepidiphila]
MRLITDHPTIDHLFGQWRHGLGNALDPYRHHVYRVFNLACTYAAADRETREMLAVAAAFHDVGIWLDGTFDYLEPSVARARGYLASIDREAWADEVAQVIRQHHKATPWPGGGAVEAFRRADWMDVGLFLLPTRIERPFLSALLGAFPRCGFHRMLIRLTLSWGRRHPLDPLPMFKW